MAVLPFISMEGVSGLEEGAKSIFKDVVVQRCIVHLITALLLERFQNGAAPLAVVSMD